MQPAGKKKTAFGCSVIYEATDSIVFTQNGIANLYGDGKVNYQKIELAAEVITMNMDSSTVFAHGVEDSLKVIKRRDRSSKMAIHLMRRIRFGIILRKVKGLISNVVSQQGEGYVTE